MPIAWRSILASVELDALATRYNLVRSVRLVSMLQAVGLSVVPHLFWADERDLRDCAIWIDDNRPEAIALDLQCAAGHLDRIVQQLGWLREHVVTPPRLLVSGVDIGARLAKVLLIWPELTITRNYVPAVAKHVDVRMRPDGSLARISSDDEPRLILERRIRLAEDWMDRHGRRPHDEAV